jgi:hypothetical protein
LIPINVVATGLWPVDAALWQDDRPQGGGYSNQSPKENIHVTRGLHHLAAGGHQLEPIDSFGDRHLTHLIVLVANHRTKMSFIG